MHKKDLEIFLSHVKGFSLPQIRLEQYSTPAHIVADLLWDAYQKGNVQGKIIADLGCGTGIFGIGALFLGAKKVYFVDVDRVALNLARENFRNLKCDIPGKFLSSFSGLSVTEFSKNVDVIFQNPPFGVQNTHADKIFLEIAFSHAPLVYSFHKYSTKNFLKTFAEHNHFSVVEVYRYKFPLKAQFSFHTSKSKFIDVGCWCFLRD